MPVSNVNSWTAWKSFHDDYINEQIKKKEHEALVKELIEGDLLNEQKSFNRKMLKRIDSISINYHDITTLFQENNTQNSHIEALEKFNAQWGYKY